jgi:hypothetical protein
LIDHHIRHNLERSGAEHGPGWSFYYMLAQPGLDPLLITIHPLGTGCYRQFQSLIDLELCTGVVPLFSVAVTET